MKQEKVADYTIIYSNVMADNPEYFITPTIYDLSCDLTHLNSIPSFYDTMVGLLGINIEINGIFEKKVSDAAICLKLVHNISMLEAFSSYYNELNNCTIDKAKIKHGVSITLRVFPEDVEIYDKQGFGIFNIHKQDFANLLSKFPDYIISYINNLIETDSSGKYDYLNRIRSFYSSINSDVENSLFMFIERNMDLFERYQNIEE